MTSGASLVVVVVVGGGGRWRKGKGGGTRVTGEGAKGRSNVDLAPFWLLHAERASVPIIIMMGLSWRIHTGKFSDSSAKSTDGKLCQPIAS